MNKIKLNNYRVRIVFNSGNTTYRTVVTKNEFAAVAAVKGDYVRAGALKIIKHINIKEGV
ncbi:MAG: hypothetical protein V3W20_00565 [Candidatus Neomarinimicrobiota bacterium]